MAAQDLALGGGWWTVGAIIIMAIALCFAEFAGLKDAEMKRWIVLRLFAVALATYGICASGWAGEHVGASQQGVGSGSCGGRNDCELAETWRATPARETIAPYFADIPVTVVGAYGRTTLNMLSSGPFALVKWPDGCCPESRKWHTGDARQSHTGGQHVIFVWPAL